MLFNTRGIVFQKVNYSESSIIVKIYTEEFGIQSYIVRGIKSKRSSFKLAYFQPLTILDLVVYHKENKNIHNIKEVKVLYAYHDVMINPVKQSFLFFLNEILFKTIKEETQNKLLFEWLFNSLTWLDLTDKKVINYHLIFLFQLSRFLGFYPKFSDHDEVNYFDLQEGHFQANRPEHPNYTSGEIVKLMVLIGKSTFEDSSELVLGNKNRRKILEVLVNYYQLHLPNIGNIKSLEVLQNIMH